MNIALFDMDGSLCDYEGTLREHLFRLLTPQEKELYANTNLWDLEKRDYHRECMKLIKRQPNWWRNLPIIHNGDRIFQLAAKVGFENHILTKGPKSNPNAWKEKVEWCHDHYGEDLNIHITSNKGLVYGKVLYDDYPDYMDLWLKHRPRGLGIMPVNGFNKDYSHPNVVKWDGSNFEEVRIALKLALDREPSERLVLNG